MKRFICALLSLFILNLCFLCGCVDERTLDRGYFESSKKLCWINSRDTGESINKVSIFEKYLSVMEFHGDTYELSEYSFEDMRYDNYKLLQAPDRKSDELYIANYTDNENELYVFRFTANSGFSKAVRCLINDDAFEPFAYTDRYIYYTVKERNYRYNYYNVKLYRYDLKLDTTNFLYSYAIKPGYYVSPQISSDGKAAFIASSLAWTDEDPDASASDMRRPSKTYLYILSDGQVKLVDEARNAVWSEDGDKIIYQPLEKKYMIYSLSDGTINTYVDSTNGRNQYCGAFAVSGNDIAYWSEEGFIYHKDGIFNTTQFDPSVVNLVLYDREKGNQMEIIGWNDDLRQFRNSDHRGLFWIE